MKKTLIFCDIIPSRENMPLCKSTLWRLIVPLIFWGSIALVILLLPGTPHEPDDLPQEIWSYYGSQAPVANQLLMHRTELLVLIMIGAVCTDMIFVLFDRRRKKRSE